MKKKRKYHPLPPNMHREMEMKMTIAPRRSAAECLAEAAAIQPASSNREIFRQQYPSFNIMAKDAMLEFKNGNISEARELARMLEQHYSGKREENPYDGHAEQRREKRLLVQALMKCSQTTSQRPPKTAFEETKKAFYQAQRNELVLYLERDSTLVLGQGTKFSAHLSEQVNRAVAKAESLKVALYEMAFADATLSFIDLHYLSVREAVMASHIFLELSNKTDRRAKTAELVTGRGKHSPNGIPKLLPAVESYLNENQIQHVKNEGSFVVFSWNVPETLRAPQW